MFNPRESGKTADKHYNSAVFEAGAILFTGANRLLNLYCLNKGAATVYLKVTDQDGGGTTSTTWYPVPAGSFISIATPGGDRCERGLRAYGYTTAGGAVACPADLWIKADWTSYP